MKDDYPSSSKDPDKSKHTREWQLLKEGDVATWVKLYKEALECAERLLGSNASYDEKRDLIQDAFITLLRKIDNGEVDIQKEPIAFLWGIMNKMCNEFWRQNKTFKNRNENICRYLEQEENPFETEETEKENWEKEVAAQFCLKSLEPDCQKVVELAIFEEKSHKEIAEIMGYTEGFVRVKKNRCMNYLRKCMNIKLSI